MIRALRCLTAVLALLALLAAPAAADTASVTDPSGDDAVGPEGRGLDITAATFDNGAARLVVTVSFAALHGGDLVISVAPRGGRGVRLVSYYRPGGPARSFVLTGSFDDAARQGAGGRVDCSRFHVEWDRQRATARLTMPPRCLSHAEYGDLRFAVLTEKPGGDTDDAPRSPAGHTRWIARG